MVETTRQRAEESSNVMLLSTKVPKPYNIL